MVTRPLCLCGLSSSHSNCTCAWLGASLLLVRGHTTCQATSCASHTRGVAPSSAERKAAWRCAYGRATDSVCSVHTRESGAQRWVGVSTATGGGCTFGKAELEQLLRQLLVVNVVFPWRECQRYTGRCVCVVLSLLKVADLRLRE